MTTTPMCIPRKPLPIEIAVNGNWAKVVKGDYKTLFPCLSFETTIWVQTQYGKKQKARKIPLVSPKGFFPAGFMATVQDYCERFHIPLTVKDYTPEPDPPVQYNLPGKVLRDYQVAAVEAALKARRGVIISPTGSGKTLMQFAVIASYPNSPAAILLQNKDLMHQTKAAWQRMFPKDKVALIGGGHKEFESSARLTIAMIQSLYAAFKRPEEKNLVNNWMKRIHTLMVDEAHHVAKRTGSYTAILSLSNARILLGWTATKPYLEEAKAALTGYIGNIITEVKLKGLIEQVMLAKPKLKLVKMPKVRVGDEVRKYQDVYEALVINNRIKNRRLIEEADNLVKEGRTVLIIVQRIEHGHNLEYIAKNLYPHLKCIFIHGETDQDARNQVRQALTDKDYDVVVTSLIWKEGVDIPTLGAVINAAGGMSEIQTIQALGRGLRIAPGKKDIVFIDTFDPSHRFLIRHFGERVCLYFDMGWM